MNDRESVASTSSSQVAWVFDLNKCVGCQNCSIACHELWSSSPDMDDQWWCTVSTRPGEGHPRGWEAMGGGYDEDGHLVLGELPPEGSVQEPVSLDWETLLDSDGEPTIQSTATEGNDRDRWMYNWEEDEGAGSHPNSWHFYFPMICMHCANPSCVEACPTDAIVKRDEDGVVVVNEEKCDGQMYCQRACPYKVIWFNEKRATAEVPSVAQKCIGCIPRLEQNTAPACARSCQARAVHFGNLNDEDSSVFRLVEKWEVALPLHPEYNTDPNVYYVPPLSSSKLDEEGRYIEESRIPEEYLESMFGKGVEQALETLRSERNKKVNGKPSELMDCLIGWRWPDDFFGSYTSHPDEAVGTDPA